MAADDKVTIDDGMVGFDIVRGGENGETVTIRVDPLLLLDQMSAPFREVSENQPMTLSEQSRLLRDVVMKEFPEVKNLTIAQAQGIFAVVNKKRTEFDKGFFLNESDSPTSSS